MLPIPYEKQIDDSACALACYTMVGRSFFPEVTAEQMARIAGYEPGYVVWAFKFWLWLLDKSVQIKNYDLLDYDSWILKGIEGLRNSVSPDEFEFYSKNTKDLNSYTVDIQAVFKNKNFIHRREKPTFEILARAVKNGKVCEITLNSSILNGENDFNIHRVVVLDVNENEIVIHDPDSGPHIKIPKELFLKAWLSGLPSPELCIYWKG